MDAFPSPEGTPRLSATPLLSEANKRRASIIRTQVERLRLTTSLPRGAQRDEMIEKGMGDVLHNWSVLAYERIASQGLQKRAEELLSRMGGLPERVQADVTRGLERMIELGSPGEEGKAFYLLLHLSSFNDSLRSLENSGILPGAARETLQLIQAYLNTLYIEGMPPNPQAFPPADPAFALRSENLRTQGRVIAQLGISIPLVLGALFFGVRALSGKGETGAIIWGAAAFAGLNWHKLRNSRTQNWIDEVGFLTSTASGNRFPLLLRRYTMLAPAKRNSWADFVETVRTDRSNAVQKALKGGPLSDDEQDDIVELAPEAIQTEVRRMLTSTHPPERTGADFVAFVQYSRQPSSQHAREFMDLFIRSGARPEDLAPPPAPGRGEPLPPGIS